MSENAAAEAVRVGEGWRWAAKVTEWNGEPVLGKLHLVWSWLADDYAPDDRLRAALTDRGRYQTPCRWSPHATTALTYPPPPGADPCSGCLGFYVEQVIGDLEGDGEAVR